MQRVNTWKYLAAALALSVGTTSPLMASDHNDTPLLSAVARNDAKLTDLYAFTRGQNLVMVLGIDPTIPPEATDYVFPTDVSYRINVDNDSRVRFDDAQALGEFGGSIVRPRKIREDLVFEVTFDTANTPTLAVRGVPDKRAQQIAAHTQLFAGLRDDPFIVKPRLERNVAAIVIELPLYLVSNRAYGYGHGRADVLLLWGTSALEGINSRLVELVGRAFRSTFPENDVMNTLHPSLHASQLGVVPDVMIYDLSRPAAYPNGRELGDDVATIIADPRIVAIDDPSPEANDVPFLDVFPYLAAPQ